MSPVYQDRFRLAFVHAAHLMAVLDARGRLLDLNPAAELFLAVGTTGVDREHPIWQCACWRSVEGTSDRVREALEAAARGESRRTSFPVRRGDGQGATLEVSLTPVRGSDGEVAVIVLDGEDVTAARHAEALLRASEAKFAGILSIAADAIITIDDEQRIVHYNQGAEAIFGWTPQEALGRELEMLIPERYRPTHRQHVDSFGRGSDAARRMGHRRAISGVRKSGEEFPAEASISRLDTPGGHLYTVVLRDITDRKRGEDAERFLAEAGEALGRSLDLDATLDTAVSLAVAMLGDWCAVEATDTTGQARHEETGDGRAGAATRIEVPLVVRARPVGTLTIGRREGGRPFDEADRALSEALARRVAMAVDNANSYETAQRATRARDEVLGVVSHDLRNPVSAVAMCAKVLLESPPESEADRRELLVAIDEATTWMQRMIQDLLDVASIEAGRLSVERREEEAAPIVTTAMTMVEASAGQREVVVEEEVAPGLPPVFADAERIVQVLVNLLANAVKFTAPGGRVRVSAARDDGGRGGVLFRVRDSGPGIPAEDLPRIFDRYWHARRSARTRGAGLGLAIVKGIVEAHGGRVWVESVVGEGSVFSFTVPAAGMGNGEGGMGSGG